MITAQVSDTVDRNNAGYQDKKFAELVLKLNAFLVIGRIHEESRLFSHIAESILTAPGRLFPVA
jgi:hypothetical protein